MTILEGKTEETVRQAFKQLNKFMLLIWRLGLGSMLNMWPSVGGRIMVLTHTGRKSGLKRKTPVNYAEIDGDIYCTAGFGKLADWYRNIKANPNIEIWLPDGWWTATAEEVTDAEKRLPIMREVLIASGFAAQAMNIDAHSISDEALDHATEKYRLLRIKREAARTGADGPGDLAWIWPLSTCILLLLLLFPKKRH